MEALNLLKTQSAPISNILALAIGLFLATAGLVKLIIDCWGFSAPASNTPPLPQVSKSILNITSIIEVTGAIALLYPQLRLFAALVLLGMTAFLELESWKMGVKSLGWKFRIPAFVVTVGLSVITFVEGVAWTRELGGLKLTELLGTKRWAGLEDREMDFDF